MRFALHESTVYPDILPAFGRALRSLGAHCVDVIDRWQARRQALRQLYLLDRRTLKDLGLDRSELQSLVADGGAGRRRRHAGH